jgi:hypothetical protein
MVGDEAAPRDGSVRGEDLVVVSQEVDVEREPHPEGVDRGAARDQEARARVLAVEQGQSQEPGAEADRDRDLGAGDETARQTIEVRRGHLLSKLPDGPNSPPDRCPRKSHDFVAKIPSHCNPAFRWVPGKARN